MIFWRSRLKTVFIGLSYFYSTANPQVSSTAWLSLSFRSWKLSYDGRSIRLKHVWALGKFWIGTSLVRWMVKRRGVAAPVFPWSALKPCKGTRDDPVTNCSSLARISDEYDSTTLKIWKWRSCAKLFWIFLFTCQNQTTCSVSGVQCFSRVYCFQSLTSILLMPQITNSSSRSSNGRNSWLGINSQKPIKKRFDQKLHTPMCLAVTHLSAEPRIVVLSLAWIGSLHRASHIPVCCPRSPEFAHHLVSVHAPSKFRNCCSQRWKLTRWRSWCCFRWKWIVDLIIFHLRVKFHLQHPRQASMQFGIDAFNIGQRNRLVQELFVERKSEPSIQTVTVENCYAQNSSNEMEVRQMIGVDAYKGNRIRYYKAGLVIDLKGNY